MLIRWSLVSVEITINSQIYKVEPKFPLTTGRYYTMAIIKIVRVSGVHYAIAMADIC